jgi:hypothetical protein
MMKSWRDLTFFEKLSIALYYRGGANGYVREYLEAQATSSRMVSTVDSTLLLGARLFRPQGKKGGRKRGGRVANK